MTARTKVTSGAWLSIFALTVLSVFAGCKRAENPPGPLESASSQNSQPGQPAEAGYFKTPFQTESEFVVENIVTDIAEMLYFARNHALPTGRAVVVNARESGGDSDAPTYDLTVQIGDSPPIPNPAKSFRPDLVRGSLRGSNQRFG
jgi:hypothetical protein